MTTTAEPTTTDWSVWNTTSAEVGDGATVVVTAPATGEVLTTVRAATAQDVDAAVGSATRAQKDWAALTYDKRAAVLRKAAQLLEADPDRIRRWLIPESGSGFGKAVFEVSMLIGELNECAALASQPYGELLRSTLPRLSMSRRIPLGVVGVISPFNFPAILSLRSVAPALAVGNAVILKPDPRTPVSGGLALADLLTEAGLPEGLLHVLPGGADVGEAIVAHPDIPCISFTGSTGAGRAIAAAAAPLLKKVHLELGGNNALLVMPDADIDAAASAGAWGSFLHQGQICMTTGRHIVHSSIADEYVSTLAQKAAQIRVGDPTDRAHALGPLIDEKQRDKVHSIVTASIEHGARLVTGGDYDDLCYRPTVLADVTVDSPAYRQEIFGPVAPVITYDTIDEAIELINDSEYGLTVGILTGNAFAAFELADRIESGMVHINDQTVGDEATIPFGGTKASGSGGHFGGVRANLDSFCETQWVTMQSNIERYPF
ncbi:benzaldehyde dehydrogenase (NAD+) [Rhodococcus wratislaviensis IFP 2016]|nr:benzaldehyde dehydrogenase (NAD+) [Rhodococcus wratislaviensis IFP 2016]